MKWRNGGGQARYVHVGGVFGRQCVAGAYPSRRVCICERDLRDLCEVAERRLASKVCVDVCLCELFGLYESS